MGLVTRVSNKYYVTAKAEIIEVVPPLRKEVLKYAPDFVAGVAEDVLHRLRLNPRRVVKSNLNLVRALSWAMVRYVGKMEMGDFVESISSMIVEMLKMGVWVEVVAPPRVGKSKGAICGVIRYLHYYEMSNYAVVVTAPNRRLAVQLYEYALQCANTVFEELKSNGAVFTRREFFKRMRVHLYLGGELSCLLGKRIHFVEDCLNCPYRKLWGKKWRKAARLAPTLNPWIAKLAGVCPFAASSNPCFYRNSVIVTVYAALDYVLRRVVEAGVRRVILVLDEYLWALLHLRTEIPYFDIKALKRELGGLCRREFVIAVKRDGKTKYEAVRLCGLIRRWNDAVVTLEDRLLRYYDKLIRERARERAAGTDAKVLSSDGYPVGDFALETLALLFTGVIDVYEAVADIIARMKTIVEKIERIKRLLKGEERVKVNRILKQMREAVDGLWSVVAWEECDVSGNRVGERRGKKAYLRWRKDDNRLVGWYGSKLRELIDTLKMNGVDVAVITTSIMTSVVMREYKNKLVGKNRRFYSYTRKIEFVLMPHESLEHKRLDFSRVVRAVRYGGSVWANPDFYLLEKNGDSVVEYRVAKSKHDNVMMLYRIARLDGYTAVSMNKQMLDLAIKVYKRMGFKVDVEGDLERNVIDYVLVRKSDGVILLFSPHSRIAMGIDPPIDHVDNLIALYGLRRPAQDYIKIKNSLYFVICNSNPRCCDGTVAYSLNDGTYVVLKRGRLLVYDLFDLQYDIHMLGQTVGRWFLREIKRLYLNVKYVGIYIPYVEPVLHEEDYEVVIPDCRDCVDVVGVKRVGVPRGKGYYMWRYGKYKVLVKLGRKSRPISKKGYVKVKYDNAEDALKSLLPRVNKHNYKSKLRRRCYYKLPNVYRSLLFMRKQLKYQDREWIRERLGWLAFKIACMVRGFQIAYAEKLPVPRGLKQWYRLWLDSLYSIVLPDKLLDWLGLFDGELRRELLGRVGFYLAALASLHVKELGETM